MLGLTLATQKGLLVCLAHWGSILHGTNWSAYQFLSAEDLQQRQKSSSVPEVLEKVVDKGLVSLEG